MAPATLQVYKNQYIMSKVTYTFEISQETAAGVSKFGRSFSIGQGRDARAFIHETVNRFCKIGDVLEHYKVQYKRATGKSLQLPIKWTKPVRIKAVIDGNVVIDTDRILAKGCADYKVRVSNRAALRTQLLMAMDFAGVLHGSCDWDAVELDAAVAELLEA